MRASPRRARNGSAAHQSLSPSQAACRRRNNNNNFYYYRYIVVFDLIFFFLFFSIPINISAEYIILILLQLLLIYFFSPTHDPALPVYLRDLSTPSSRSDDSGVRAFRRLNNGRFRYTRNRYDDG